MQFAPIVHEYAIFDQRIRGWGGVSFERINEIIGATVRDLAYCAGNGPFRRVSQNPKNIMPIILHAYFTALAFLTVGSLIYLSLLLWREP